MHAPPPPEAFVGDGQFAGDGGASLQRLWDAGDWTMIRGCPGRYVLRGRRSRPARVAGALATQLDTRALLAAALGEEAAARVCVQRLRSARCADVVAVGVLADGGGVLTYCKREGNGGDTEADASDVVHVHTLNTASGLRRKLEGLDIDYVLQEREATASAV
ncbi:hypothetical protein PybrP1_004642 [[Pythium] brassicae (nom. inval.)]|nr:hypothetical protein PybrP1_004642 [[Pythium] brassicae (nom. inval.)]